MKRYICLLALPLLSIAACLDMSDQDSADGTSSLASAATADPGAGSPQVAAPTPGPLCERHGAFCVGAPTIAFGDPVVETLSGRTLAISTSGAFVLLALSADPTRCVAVKNGSTSTDGLVEIRACNNPAGNILWIPQRGSDSDGQSCIFQSQVGLFLSGHNNGTQFHVRRKGDPDHWFQQFANPGISCP